MDILPILRGFPVAFAFSQNSGMPSRTEAGLGGGVGLAKKWGSKKGEQWN
jgi:hypothetical protein